jgi:molybdopterin-guanine dinucleotide biosynthesis protein A
VILAGGMNKRFLGKEKAFFKIGESRIMDRIFIVFKALFKEIVLVTNNPTAFLEWDLTIVTDVFNVRSALTGIHTGLFYSTYPHAFFSACDTPFLKKEIVKYLLSCIDSKTDVILPQTSAGFEPLCAVYSKKLLSNIEKQLRHGNLKIQRAFGKHHVRRITEPELREKEPELLSFFNINTPEDLATARKIETKRGEHGKFE